MLYFKEKSKIYFEITDFKLNTPIIIKHNNLYLRCHEEANIVDFCETDDHTGRQQWIVESDNENIDIYYIKNAFIRADSVKYLGCPNIDTQTHLYTTKNRFTRWNIISVEINTYILQYVGDKFDINSHSIVIARYNEDLDWVFPYRDCVIVYNKGLDNISNFPNVIKLKNQGREGDTYLHHMIEQYDTLSERVTFLQGESLAHNDTILFALDNYEKMSDFQPLGLIWLEYKKIPPKPILNKYKTVTDYGLEYLVIKINSNLDYIEDYYFFDIGIINVKNGYFKDYECESDIIGHFLGRCEIDIKKQRDAINYSWSALFSMKRDRILMYNRDMYKRIKEQLVFTHNQAGSDGYVLEKLWSYFFEEGPV
jgi:hypothetical protein